MVQLCYWSKTLSHFSPSFSTTPSIFFLSLSLLHNTYLSIFLSISFLSFPFPFSPLLHWHWCRNFCPLWVWQGLTLAICVLKLREGGKRGLLLHFFLFFLHPFFSHSFIIIFRCICLICAFVWIVLDSIFCDTCVSDLWPNIVIL